jgi:hypothetical protein
MLQFLERLAFLKALDANIWSPIPSGKIGCVQILGEVSHHQLSTTSKITFLESARKECNLLARIS